MINANIISGLKPFQIDTPDESMTKRLTLQDLMRKGQAGDMAMQDAQRAQADDAQLRGFSQEAGGDPKKLRDLMYGGGMYKQGQAQDKLILDRAETQGKVDKGKSELIDARLKQSRGFLDTVQTPDEYMAWHEANHKDDVLGPVLAARGVTAESARASITKALQTPGGFEQLLNQSRVGIEKFTEMNKPTYQTRNTGSTTDTLQLPGMGGAPTVVNSIKNTQSPDNKASVGASYANAGATREVAKATRDAANIQRDQATEMKLGDDWRAQSKDFKAVGDAYKQISATLEKSTTSPAATLAAATKFMKLLDPGSVVRESELGMALAATGVFDRATNYVNTLKYGKVLTPNQAADFKSITAQIYSAAQAGQQQVDVNYKRQAEAYKLRPEMIVQDLGQNAKPTQAPKGSVKPSVSNW